MGVDICRLCLSATALGVRSPARRCSKRGAVIVGSVKRSVSFKYLPGSV